MKKLIFKILLFSTPVFIFLSFTEFFLRNLPNDYTFKNAYMQEGSNEVKNLILGSSHSYYGINPLFFQEETFNLSHVSQTLDYDYELMMKFKDDFKNLKRIYIPISYFSLWDRLELENEAWRCKNYTLYYDIDKSQNFKHSFELLSLPFKKNMTRVFSWFFRGKTEVTCSNLGWGLGYLFKNQKNLVISGKSAASRNTFRIDTSGYVKRFKESDQILREILNWSIQRDIKVILFMPPAYETYIESLDKKQLETTIDYSNKIAGDYKNCVYYNFLEDSSFVTRDFFDADHLSKRGAKKLSEKLNNLELSF